MIGNIRSNRKYLLLKTFIEKYEKFLLIKKVYHNYFTHIRFVFLSQQPHLTDIQAFCKRNYEYSL